MASPANGKQPANGGGTVQTGDLNRRTGDPLRLNVGRPEWSDIPLDLPVRHNGGVTTVGSTTSGPSISGLLWAARLLRPRRQFMRFDRPIETVVEMMSDSVQTVFPSQPGVPVVGGRFKGKNPVRIGFVHFQMEPGSGMCSDVTEVIGRTRG